MQILLIEDEKRLAHNIARSLREACGYAVVRIGAESKIKLIHTVRGHGYVPRAKVPK